MIYIEVLSMPLLDILKMVFESNSLTLTPCDIPGNFSKLRSSLGEHESLEGLVKARINDI
jgi:hypothetical protein